MTAGCTGIEWNWYLIQVPYLEDTERDALIYSGTVAGLCSATEANQVFRIRGGRHLAGEGRQRVRNSRQMNPETVASHYCNALTQILD